MNDNIAYLLQGITLLESLDRELFTACPPGLEHGGIGPQFRHVVDYYRCFLRDVRTGRIDYDCRERDVEVETDREACIARLRELVRDLECLPDARLPERLAVRADANPILPEAEQFATS